MVKGGDLCVGFVFVVGVEVYLYFLCWLVGFGKWFDVYNGIGDDENFFEVVLGDFGVGCVVGYIGVDVVKDVYVNWNLWCCLVLVVIFLGVFLVSC